MPDVAIWKSGNSLKISERHLSNISEEKLDAYPELRKTGFQLISEGKFASILVVNNKNPEKYFESSHVDLETVENPTISHFENLLSDEQKFIQVTFFD